jgi:hypothetical protein
MAPGFKHPSHSSPDSSWKRGPLYKNPPTQLNFFELLRASLGDSQFHDVWLVPEAQGSTRSTLWISKMAAKPAWFTGTTQPIRGYVNQGKVFFWMASWRMVYDHPVE